MSSSCIYELARRRAAVERRIEEAMKAPAPDPHYIPVLKKLRLACRQRIRQANSQTPLRACTSRRKRRAPPRSVHPASSTDMQFTEGS